MLTWGMAETATRGERARKVLVGAGRWFVGWLVGAAVLSAFGTGRIEDDIGLVALVFGALVSLSVGYDTVRAGRLPTLRRSGPKRSPNIQSGIGSLVTCLMFPVVGAELSGGGLTTLWLWWLSLALVGASILIEDVPRLIRPGGYADLRPVGPAPVWAASLVAGLLLAAIGAAWIANDAIARIRSIPPILPPDFAPELAGELLAANPAFEVGWLPIMVTFFGFAFWLWWLGAAQAFFVAIATFVFVFMTWSGYLWVDIASGQFAIDGSRTTLLVEQLAVGVLLLAAMAVASAFRPGRNPLALTSEIPITTPTVADPVIDDNRTSDDPGLPRPDTGWMRHS